MQWPLIALEQCHPMPQAFASGVFVQPVELAFMGVYPTHEPVSRRFRRRFEVGMVATVQHQFVAALHARIQHAAKLRLLVEGLRRWKSGTTSQVIGTPPMASTASTKGR